MTSPHPHPLDNDYDDMPSPLPRRQCEINNTTTRVTMTTIMTCHHPHPCPHPHPLDNDLALALSLTTRATSPDSLAHAHKRVYTCRITVCECMHARWQVLPICSYPWVNPCGYEYGSPAAYPLENPYLPCGYGFFGGLGTGMALDTRGLPVLLPSWGHVYHKSGWYHLVRVIAPCTVGTGW